MSATLAFIWTVIKKDTYFRFELFRVLLDLLDLLEKKVILDIEDIQVCPDFLEEKVILEKTEYPDKQDQLDQGVNPEQMEFVDPKERKAKHLQLAKPFSLLTRLLVVALMVL